MKVLIKKKIVLELRDSWKNRCWRSGVGGWGVEEWLGGWTVRMGYGNGVVLWVGLVGVTDIYIYTHARV